VAKVKTPVRFKARRRASCPACLDRDALNPLGRPAFRNGVRLTAGCQVCEGKGYVIEGEPVGSEWRRYPWVIIE
jgi:hypothetical protein